VNEGSVDAFLWELFTTKPWFDKKELSYLGVVATPWPAFVFVSKTSADYSVVQSEADFDANADGVHGVKASEKSGALSQEKARLIRECLFPALAEGVAIFRTEAQESFLGEGQGICLFFYFSLVVNLFFFLKFRFFSSSSPEYPAYHG